MMRFVVSLFYLFVSLLVDRPAQYFVVSQVTPSMEVLAPRERVKTALKDPNLALMVLVVGILLIAVEFSMPGLVLPGAVGAILVAIGTVALSVLPLSWAGVTLLVFALASFAIELKFATHGVLSTVGAAALVLSLTLLVDTPDPEMRIRLSTALSVTIPLVLIAGFLVRLALRARRNKVSTGAEGMIGQLGIALGDIAPQGWVLVHGERWQAQFSESGLTGIIRRGAHVRVIGLADLLLRVEPVDVEQESLA